MGANPIVLAGPPWSPTPTSACGVKALDEVAPLHVAAWIERQTRHYSAPTVKQQLAAIRHIFDWLVLGQIVPVNPASSDLIRALNGERRSGLTSTGYRG